MTKASDHRLHIPLGVKLKSALLAAGFTEEQIESGAIQYDHHPSLGTRPVVDGEMVPHPNDWRYIRPMLREDHDIKTRGTGATTAGSDVGNAAKVKRIEKDPAGGEAFRAKLLATKTGGKPPETKKRKHQWPKRPLNPRKKP